MRNWSIPVTNWLVWFLLAIGVLAIGYMAATAHSRQMSEVIERGPLLVDYPDRATSRSDPTTETELVPIAEPENGEAIEMCEGVGRCQCETSDGTCFCARWLHGYYDFRPYHPGHLTRQQQFVKLWGGDARNPYANHVFKTVYAQYETDRRASASSRTYRLPPAPKVPRTRK